jgi:hypothetical protein
MLGPVKAIEKGAERALQGGSDRMGAAVALGGTDIVEEHRSVERASWPDRSAASAPAIPPPSPVTATHGKLV